MMDTLSVAIHRAPKKGKEPNTDRCRLWIADLKGVDNGSKNRYLLLFGLGRGTNRLK